MDITYTSGSKEEKQIKVMFDPPLLGYEEVKPRMIGMKADAEESLGMVSSHPRLFSHYFLAPPTRLLEQHCLTSC
jgi:hypothetical protein